MGKVTEPSRLTTGTGPESVRQRSDKGLQIYLNRPTRTVTYRRFRNALSTAAELYIGDALAGPVVVLVRCQRKMSRGKWSDTTQLGALTISLIRRLAAVLHNRYASAGSSPRFVPSHSIM